jgi:membrane protein
MFKKVFDKIREIYGLIIIVAKSFGEYQCFLWATSIAYFSIFAIFPLSLLMLSIGGEFLELASTRDAINNLINEFIPFASIQINSIIEQSLESRGPATAIAIIGLLWSTTSVFGILETGLSKIWNTSPRTYWKKKALAALAIMIIGIVFILSFSLGPIISIISEAIDSPYLVYFNIFFDYFLSIFAVYLLFRIFPNRNVSWKPAMIGSVIVVAAIQIAKFGFLGILDSAYVNYGAVYGSLAWMVALGIYILVTMNIFLFGAVLTAEIERNYFLD